MRGRKLSYGNVGMFLLMSCRSLLQLFLFHLLELIIAYKQCGFFVYWREWELMLAEIVVSCCWRSDLGFQLLSDCRDLLVVCTLFEPAYP